LASALKVHRVLSNAGHLEKQGLQSTPL